MKNEWVPVEEDTHQIGLAYKNLSDDVYVRFSDGTTGVGYYDYRSYCWRNFESKEYKDCDIVSWKSI